uniref:Uncharacterized protein n=1 Tax=Peronospora matthiolae TaxID=2874970 RepID=A0AAV1T2Y1_9STRA
MSSRDGRNASGQVARPQNVPPIKSREGKRGRYDGFGRLLICTARAMLVYVHAASFLHKWEVVKCVERVRMLSETCANLQLLSCI